MQFLLILEKLLQDEKNRKKDDAKEKSLNGEKNKLFQE